MGRTVSTTGAQWALWALLCVSGLSTTGLALAAGLGDPTRPPPGIQAAQQSNRPTPPAASNTAPATELGIVARSNEPVAAPKPLLQSLHRTQQGFASALINGQLVRIGDRVGDALVQDIRAQGVLLRYSHGATVWLTLFDPAPTAPTVATATVDKEH